MNKPGYLIAQNRSAKAFFTSSSSYDRPKWTIVAEARVYATAELAQQAVTKLLKNGAYEARIVSLSEAMSFDFYDKKPSDVTAPTGDQSQDSQESEGMVAHDQSDICPECGRSSCECDPEDGESSDTEAAVDSAAGTSLDSMHTEPEDVSPGEEMANRLSGTSGSMNRGMRESATMPAKPPLDAQPSENKNTVLDAKPAEKIKYKNPSTEDDKPDTDLTNSGALPHDAKVKVPAEVMSDLKAAIAEFDKCADYSNGSNDDKASLALTISAAFQTLQQCLELGTVDGVKQAQVEMTSWMNVITSHLPVSVQKFIYMGGRKPTLADTFYSIRDEKKK